MARRDEEVDRAANHAYGAEVHVPEVFLEAALVADALAPDGQQARRVGPGGAPLPLAAGAEVPDGFDGGVRAEECVHRSGPFLPKN